MRIAILSPVYLPDVGGAELGAHELAKTLIKKGHEVVVITPRKKLSWPQYEVLDGVKVIRFFCASPIQRGVGWYQWAATYASLGRILRQFRPDVLNMHYIQHTGYAGDYWARRLGIPTVVTLVGYDVYDPSVQLPEHWVNKMRRTLSKQERLVAASSFVKDTLIERFEVDADKIQIIPYGVDTTRFKPGTDGSEIRARYGIGHDEIVAIAVQRLDVRKGLAFLLDAIARLKTESGPAVRFLICGRGPEKERLQEYAKRLDIEDRVIFAGYVADEELPQYYQAADLFVLHSLHEGLGIVVLEAMASGLPPIITDAGGTVDMVVDQEDGLVVPAKAPVPLAAALRRLAEEPDLRRRLAARARASVVERFRWDLIADQYVGVFNAAFRN